MTGEGLPLGSAAMRKFLIYSPTYTRKWGGIISLHKLCHLINELGGTAFIHPNYLDVVDANFANIDAVVEYARSQWSFVQNFDERGYVSSRFNTPVRHILNDGQYGDDWIIVYPEITAGNPLGARNVVRWLMHIPGFHTGRINFGQNEYHIRFNGTFGEFHLPTCYLSQNYLMVMDYDFDLFNADGAPTQRSGSAYLIKKGFGKPMQHDLTDSIQIDNLEQEEIARALKSVKTFYSYDTQSAYSQLAVLCGCDSVVIPDDGVSKTQCWNGEIPIGIAYGVEEIAQARESAHLVKPHLQEIKDSAVGYVLDFMKEADAFFDAKTG